jgi:hypothetical protein
MHFPNELRRRLAKLDCLDIVTVDNVKQRFASVAAVTLLVEPRPALDAERHGFT